MTNEEQSYLLRIFEVVENLAAGMIESRNRLEAVRTALDQMFPHFEGAYERAYESIAASHLARADALFLSAIHQDVQRLRASLDR